MSVDLEASDETNSEAGRVGRLSPATVGILLCAFSALFYTATNIIRRHLAGLEANDSLTSLVWVNCNQESVTVVLLAPWLLWQWSRGRKVLPPPRALLAIVLTALALQVIGNQAGLWAMRVVGLSVAVPTMFGVMLLSAALLGRFFLGEHPSARSWAALGLIIVAIAILTFGAEQARGGRLGLPPVSAKIIALGVLASAAGGLTFAGLTVTTRSTVNGNTPISTLMFLVTFTGTLSLGTTSLIHLGVERILATPPEQWAWMWAAGLTNFVGFMSLAHGLKLTPVVNANVISASQVAMAAAAGLLLFHEPVTAWLLVGIVLTIVGLLLVDRSRTPPAEI